MSQPFENFYRILGVQKNATPEEISRAFRKLSLQFHPDKNPNGAEVFKKINSAYQTLTNIQLRSEYDQTAEDDDEDILMKGDVEMILGGLPLSEVFIQQFQKCVLEFLIKQRTLFKKSKYLQIISILAPKPQKPKLNIYLDRIQQASDLSDFFKQKQVKEYQIHLKPTIKFSPEILPKPKENIYCISPLEIKLEKAMEFPNKYLTPLNFNLCDYWNFHFKRQIDYPVVKPAGLKSIPVCKTQESVLWVPDAEREICPICANKFSFFRRRHHCRMCGDIQCSKCQSKQQILHLGFIKETIVCKNCEVKMPLMNKNCSFKL